LEFRIDWHGGAGEYVNIELPPFDADEWTDLIASPTLRTHNIGMGTVTYHNSSLHGDDDRHVILRVDGRVVPATIHTVDKRALVIYGIPTTTRGELYTLCGLWVAAIGLILSGIGLILSSSDRVISLLRYLFDP
jgi:hypothetical protein